MQPQLQPRARLPVEEVEETVTDIEQRLRDNVIRLDDRRPHKAAYVVCMSCAKDWVSVSPAKTKLLECPACGKPKGEPVQINSIEWFTRFMSGKNRAQKTLVLLNAKRMSDEGLI